MHQTWHREAYCGSAFVCVSQIRFTFLSFVQNWKFGNWTFLFLSKISEKHFQNFFFVSTWLLYFWCRLLSDPLGKNISSSSSPLPECFLSILLSSRSSKNIIKLFRLLKLRFNFISEKLHWSVNDFYFQQNVQS